MNINIFSKDSVVNLALDTLKIQKQALIFVNSKRSAEKCAEDISKKCSNIEAMSNFKEEVLNALPKPTKQCEKLAKCVEKGIAFHHSGLAPKQKELIENGFRDGKIKIICCTTTMAAGMDLPAFRSIIRDLKRYTHHGMDYIPVIEYHQCAGRAGRPGKEDYGEAIVIAKDGMDKQEIIERFILGKPEDIYSKLAVEPVLRVYVLSLIVSKIAKTKEGLIEFFSKTFWAHQYKDMKELKNIIQKMLKLLTEWGFIKDLEFISADELGKLTPSRLGERIAQLYLDPYTANHLIKGIEKADKLVEPFELLQLICDTLEMRPLLRVKVKEEEFYENMIGEKESSLLIKIPSYFDSEYGDFLNSIKTANMFMDWMNEEDEEYLLEKYNIRPGETRYKISIADWLLYSLKEISLILDKKWLIKEIEKLRVRIKYGVKEELLGLLKLKGIGRVRARKMFNSGLKTLKDVKKIDLQSLEKIIGEKRAISIKKQLGTTNYLSKT